MNRKLSLAIILLLLPCALAWSQDQRFERNLQEASVIVEGRVVEQEAFWNKEQTFIYTKNTIEVHRVLKGNLISETFEINSLGGRIDNRLISTSEKKVEKGMTGVFFAVPSKKESGYEIAPDGFIQYDKLQKVAASKHVFFWDVEKDLIEPITNFTQKSTAIERESSLFYERSTFSNQRVEAVDIASFLPVTATAGTQTKLTINGTGFGDERQSGAVIFTSAELGGQTTQEPFNEGEYISWSDTKIEIFVPSFAGTGPITVRNGEGETFTSFNDLEIPYALNNGIPFGFFPDFSQDAGIIPNLLGTNPDGGYTIFIDPRFFQDNQFLTPITNALNRWRCATGVNFKLAANQGPINDFFVFGKNAIAIQEDFGGQSFSFSDVQFCDTGEEKVAFLNRFFIGLSIANNVWNFEGDPDLGQRDFETELLRLFGKMAQLNNVNNPNDLMYFEPPLGDTRDISPLNLEAANVVVEQSRSIAPECELIPMTFLTDLPTDQNCDNGLSPAEARFDAPQTEFCESPQEVRFDDNSRNANTWFWEFEGGRPATSEEQNPLVAYDNPGTYSVKLTVSNPTSSDSEEKTGYIVIGEGSTLTLDLGDDQVVCQGEVITLDAGIEDATYEWSNGATSQAIEVTREGTYSVTVTKTGCVFEDEVTISFNEIATVDAGASLSLCGGDPVKLEATEIEGATYSWTPTIGLSDPNIRNPLASPLETTIYTVTVNTGTICGEIKDSLRVSVSPPIELLFFPEEDTLKICGTEGFLNAFIENDFNASYEWSTGQVGVGQNFIAVNEPGEYWVKATASTGCSVSDTVVIEFVEEIEAIVPSDTTICAGTPLQLSASGGQFYNWEPFEIFRDPFVSDPVAFVDDTTRVTVTVFSGFECEPVSFSFNINTVPAPRLDIGPKVLDVCEPSVTLQNRYEFATYEWSDGSTEPSLTVTESGTYFVTMTPEFCSEEIFTDTIQININTVDLDLGTDTLVCTEAFLIEPFNEENTPEFPLEYLWSDGSTEPTLLVNESGEYSVTITDPSCEKEYTDTLQVTFITIEEPFVQDTITTCDEEVILQAKNDFAQSYLWSTDSTSQALTVTESGMYKVSIVNFCGDTIEDSITVIFNEPSLDLGQDTIRVCEAPFVLDAGNEGATFLWSDESEAQTLEVFESGQYSVTVTDTCGNVLTDTAVVIFNELVVDLGTDTLRVCEAPYVLDAGNKGATFLWSDESEAQTLEVFESGQYLVTVTDTCGFVATDSIVVIFHEPSLDLGADTLKVCEGPITLDAGAGRTSYLWSDGTTEQTATFNGEGLFSVTVVDSCGVTLTDSIRVIFETPTLDLGADTLIACAPEDFVLDAGNPGATYLWSTGSTEQKVTITEAGTYSVEVQPQGCTFTLRDTIYVTFPQTELNLGEDIQTCEASVTLDAAGNPSNSFMWSDGSNNQTLTVTESGVYSVTVTNVCGEAFTDSVSVVFHEAQSISLEEEILSCDPELSLSVETIPNATYLWSNGSTEASTTVTESDTLSVTVTDSCGIVQTAQINVGLFEGTAAGFTQMFQGEGSVQFTNTTTSSHPLNFLWEFGDGATSTEENPTHTYNVMGNFTAKLTVTSQVCESSASAEQNVEIIVAGLEDDLVRNSIEIYPNPSDNGIFNLKWRKGEAQIQVFNVLGKLIMTQKARKIEDDFQLNLDGNPKGMYLVQILTENVMTTKRVIVR